MLLRIGTSLTICLAVLISNGLGLNKGIVLCVDGDGHFALESAHEQHLHAHKEITDHLPHEFPSGGEHGKLHAATEGCFDATVSSIHLRSAAPPSLCPTDFPAAPYLIAPNPDLQLSPFGNGRRTASPSTAIPRAEIACLRAIILLV